MQKNEESAELLVKNIKYKVYDHVQELVDLEIEKEILDIKIKELSDHIKNICHHPEDQQVVKEYYFDGNYFDRASTTYTTRCQLCGTVLGRKTKTHSWYG